MNKELFYATEEFFGINIEVICSPIGIRKILINKNQESERLTSVTLISSEDDRMLQAFIQLREYFLMKRKVFTLPLEIAGSDFQKQVWEELQKIPYGETISYNQLALRLGDQKLIRAAASANGANPLPIVIPCHRVIGTDGSLTGYGGGLDVKQKLLELEGSWTLSLFQN